MIIMMMMMMMMIQGHHEAHRGGQGHHPAGKKLISVCRSCAIMVAVVAFFRVNFSHTLENWPPNLKLVEYCFAKKLATILPFNDHFGPP